MFSAVNSPDSELPKNEVVHQIKDLVGLLKQMMLKLDPELLHHVLFALKNIINLVFDFKAKELKEVHSSYCNLIKDVVLHQC